MIKYTFEFQRVMILMEWNQMEIYAKQQNSLKGNLIQAVGECIRRFISR